MPGNECPLEMFYSLKEIYKSAGDREILRKAIDIIRDMYSPDNDAFVRWWYTHEIPHLGRSPEQICREGRQYELECILVDVLLGSGGG